MPTGHIFPTLTPSQPGLTPLGHFPKKNFRDSTVLSQPLQYGVNPVDSKLEMTFTNIADGEALTIINNYELVNGGSDAAGRQDNVDLYPAGGCSAFRCQQLSSRLFK